MRLGLPALLIAALANVSWADEAGQARTVQQRFESLAASTNHFATDHIVRNRWSERRWPAGFLEQQKNVLAELLDTRDAHEEFQDLLQHPDAKVRTLALGALFIREDPRDLPLIAKFLDDGAATFRELRSSHAQRSRPLATLVL